MFIRSDRLFLRPAWPEDAEDLHAALQDRQIARNLSRVPWPYGLEHARAYAGRAHMRGLPQFLATLPGEPGAPIVGGAGLVREGEGVELALWVARDYRGRGLGTEAGRAVLAVAGAIGHRQLRASPFIDNPASGHILEKLGFRRTGRIIERYSESRRIAFPAREYLVELGDSGSGPRNDDLSSRDAGAGLCAA